MKVFVQIRTTLAMMKKMMTMLVNIMSLHVSLPYGLDDFTQWRMTNHCLTHSSPHSPSCDHWPLPQGPTQSSVAQRERHRQAVILASLRFRSRRIVFNVTSEFMWLENGLLEAFPGIYYSSLILLDISPLSAVLITMYRDRTRRRFFHEQDVILIRNDRTNKANSGQGSKFSGISRHCRYPASRFQTSSKNVTERLSGNTQATGVRGTLANAKDCKPNGLLDVTGWRTVSQSLPSPHLCADSSLPVLPLLLLLLLPLYY